MAEIYRFEGFTLDIRRGYLLAGEREVALRPKSFELLRFLIENADRLVSKDDLMQAVWPNVFVTDDSLKRCMSEVRAALSDKEQRIIRTVPRRGFRFTGSLLQIATDRGPPSQVPLGAQGELPRLSIVVLPFVNLNNDPDQEYFADGLTESLTADLSRVPGSFVIARTSAFAYKGKATTVKQIGRDLDVRYVLEGSVQRGARRIRVNAQLIDALDGGHLWAESYDRQLGDFLELQDDITKCIALALNVELLQTPSQRLLYNRQSFSDGDDLAARGWAIVNERFTRENVVSAREFFEAALCVDNDSAPALLGLCRTHVSEVSVLGTALEQPPEEHMRWREEKLAIAERSIARAIVLAPNNALVHAHMGIVLRARGRQEEALAEFDRAMQLNPNEAVAYSSASACRLQLGHAGEALALAQHALRLDPLGRMTPPHMMVGRCYLWLERDEEAIPHLQKAADMNPIFGNPSFYLAAALALLSSDDEARAAIACFHKATPNYSLSRNRAQNNTQNPIFLRQQERVHKALRRLGFPE